VSRRQCDSQVRIQMGHRSISPGMHVSLARCEDASTVGPTNEVAFGVDRFAIVPVRFRNVA
jgi:hypothetical protein